MSKNNCHKIRIKKLVFFYLSFNLLSSFSQNQLIYDKDQSMYFGATNMLTIHRGLYTLQDSILPDTLRNEHKFYKKIAGIGYRFSKLFFLDLQENYMICQVQHEVFGHGARYREAGSRKNSYKLDLLPPLGTGRGKAVLGDFQLKRSNHEVISAGIGGVEANKVLANSICENVYTKNQMHYSEALLYLISQNDQFLYIWTDKWYQNDANRDGGGDMLGYVSKLNLFYPNSNNYTIAKMSKQSLISLVNPMQLYAAYNVLINYGILGRRYMKNIPMIRFGAMKYLPSFNFELSPFGNAFVFENNFKLNKLYFKIDALVSDPNFNNFYAVRIKANNVINPKDINLGVYVSIWNQPELDLTSNSYNGGINVLPDKIGGSIIASISVFPFKSYKKCGLYAQAGYKSKGFEIGNPLGESIIFRYGFNLNF